MQKLYYLVRSQLYRIPDQSSKEFHILLACGKDYHCRLEHDSHFRCAYTPLFHIKEIGICYIYNKLICRNIIRSIISREKLQVTAIWPQEYLPVFSLRWTKANNTNRLGFRSRSYSSRRINKYQLKWFDIPSCNKVSPEFV